MKKLLAIPTIKRSEVKRSAYFRVCFTPFSIMKRAPLCFIALFTFTFSLFTHLCNAQLLYGMAADGGTNNVGTILEYNAGSSAFTNKVNFTGGSGSYLGGNPYGNMIEASDGNFYGMTEWGGSGTYLGTIFKYTPASGVFTNLVSFTGSSGSYLGENPYGSLMQASDGNLYGMTSGGGAGTYNGTIFKYNISTGTFTSLVSFTDGSGSYVGASPYGSLMQASDGNLYGMTSGGGAGTYNGTIFKYNLTGGVFTSLVSFTDGSGSYVGADPYGSLIQASDGNLYGMTSGGGSGIYNGTIFNYNLTGGVFTSLVSFTGNSGSYLGGDPYGDLMQASDGNLYGMTSWGGSGTYSGTIFNYNLTGGVFTSLVSFTDGSGSYVGGSPYGSLIQASDGNLYGMTELGGSGTNTGTIFNYNLTGGVFTSLVSFTGNSGSYLGSDPTFSSLWQYWTITPSVTANVSCTGGNNGNATITPSGGTAPYTYSWSTGSTSNPTGTVLSAGTYTVTVTDAHGHSLTSSVTITQPATPVGVTISSVTNVSCYGGTGSATANAATGGTSPYFYEWDPNGGTNLTGTALSAGTYTIIVIDKNECVAEATATITQPAAPLWIGITSVTNVSCNGGNGGSVTINAGNSGSTTFSYEGAVQNWTVPAGVTSATITVAGGSGGSATSDAGGTDYGGNGTLLTGISSVIPGDNLSIVVGGAGGNGGIQAAGGGGGGSFVYDSNAAAFMGASAAYNSGYLYLVAAGGGGGGFGGQAGSAGGTDIIGTTTNGGGDGTGGTGGNGGSVGSATYLAPGGAGGAGWVGAGTGGTGGSPTSHDSYGGSPYDNFSGGAVTQNTSAGDVGGYGGGGGGGNDGGGGGGGYNGGGGGSDNGNGGGGGGSYLNGTLLSGPAATNGGNGYVTIAYSGSLGGTSPYTYSWTNGTSTVSTSLSATGLSAGTYTLTVTDNGRCTATASATIVQNPPVTVSIVSTMNILCNGGTGSATAASASGGTPAQIITVAGNGVAGYTGDGGLATSAEIYHPAGVAIDASGDIYIADENNNVVRKVNSSGNISTIAGNGTAGYSGDGIAATSAELSGPIGIAIDGSGNIYIVDNGNNRIRKMNTSGIISTVAGDATQGYNGDGIAATTAELHDPTSVAVDGIGNIYIADDRNNRVREVNTSGIINTIAGNGTAGFNGDGIAATSAELITPVGVTLDTHGNIYIADNSSYRVREINSSGIINTVAGNGTQGYNGDGIAATSAELNDPIGVAVDLSGNIYITDITNNRVRQVSNSGIISTLAGNGTSGYNGDGIAATSAELNFPQGVGVDGAGNIYIADWGNSRVRKVNGYSYSWSPNGGNSAIASNLSAGTYTVTASDGKGCSASASTTITQPAHTLGGTISVTNKITCNALNNGSVSFNASGGISPYTFSWSNSATTASISGLSAGTYSITVHDANTCSATASVTMSQVAGLTVTTTVTDNVICNGGTTGLAKATVSGGTAPFTYSWSPGSSTKSTASALTAGTYTVSVTDKNGCNSSAAATITQPLSALSESLASLNNATCHGGTGSAGVTVSGGTPPYTYVWIPVVSTTATATGLTARSYVIGIRDAYDCTTNLTFSITQPFAVRDSVVKASIVNELCNGSSTGSATVGVKYGTSPFTYSWSPNGGSSVTATGMSAGTYTVTVKDECGNSATAYVTITQPNVLRDSISSNTCSGGLGKSTVGVKGGAAPYTYSWSPGGGSKATMSNLSPGTYTITVTDKNGCSSTIYNTITCPPSLASPVQNNNSENECCPAGIENVSLYPNPNTGQFTIAGIEKGMLIEVYDYTGRKISVIRASDETVQLNMSNQANGLYLIRITDKDGNLVSQKKVVIEK